MGLTCGIPNKFQEIEWYGKGPSENYLDKRIGAKVGIYQLQIDDFMETYVQPQESGNRTDVRWMCLRNKTDGLEIIADSLLSMSAWLYSSENIKNSKHVNELKNPGYITLNIDLIQMGIGGNDSWSPVSAPLEKYQIPAQNYSYSFWLKPINK